MCGTFSKGLEDKAGGEKPHRGRYMGSATKTGIAVEAGRSGGIAKGRNGSIRSGKARGLVGIDTGDAELAFARTGKAVSGAEFFAHEHEEAVARAATEVIDADPGGIDAASCPPDRKKRAPEVTGGGEEVGFLADAVDGVDDEGIGRLKKSFGIGFAVEGRFFVNDNPRIDGAEAIGHDLDFRGTDGFLKGMGLAVDIGQADIIKIHQGQGADTGAGEGFGDP